MSKKISLNEKIFIAGSNGMVGSAICRSLIKNGYGNKKNTGILLTPKRQELNLLDINSACVPFPAPGGPSKIKFTFIFQILFF